MYLHIYIYIHIYIHFNQFQNKTVRLAKRPTKDNGAGSTICRFAQK